MSLQVLMPTLDAVGYAKVIVSFRRTTLPASAGVALTSAGSHAPVVDPETVMSLQNHFIMPPSTRAAEPAAAAAAAAGVASVRSPETAPRMRVFPRLGLALGFVDKSGAAALDADARVAGFAKAPQLSLIRPVAVGPAASVQPLSWGLKRLGVEGLWNAGFRGQGVRVGHLDTGVDGAHPALQSAIRVFAKFDDTGEIVPGAPATDSDQHGTHTAGTIAGRATAKGSFGMAPEAELACGMVIEGGQVVDRILSGLEWVVAQKCRILSMSLGLRDATPAFQAVTDALRAAGVLPIIAIGNERADTSRSPGNYANVLSVGAIDVSDMVPDFSSSQRFDRPNEPLVPLLVAPGVGVLSCIPGGGYAEMDGSSMATPHVAGLAALLFSAKPNATIDEVESAILASCIRPATVSESRGNRGVPDAARAYQALTGNALPAADPVAAVAARPAGTPKKAVRKAAASKKTPAKKIAAGKNAPKTTAASSSPRKKTVAKKKTARKRGS